MRHESTITSLSWIPREAVEGSTRVAFDAGVAHYDTPPPELLSDIEELRASDGFRFANRLDTWLEVDDAGRITDCGYAGGGLMGATTLRLGPLARTFQAVRLPDIRRDPERGSDFVRFVQTTGGRTGVPAPRRVRRPPFVQWQAPLVWTTLSLTLHADGRATGTLEGASQFPRHWVYDANGRLSEKSGLADFDDWYRESFGPYTPWGDQDSRALVVAVESALEHRLSEQVMAEGQEPEFRKLREGTTLVSEGETGSAIYLVLDGVLGVEREGKRLAEYGPGAMLGERAHLEGGKRSSTLVAVTNCRVASVEASQLDRAALDELAKGHHREDAVATSDS
jgi:Cyclic nucleotide-binding domain